MIGIVIIMFILGGGAMSLSSDSNKLVIWPLESMMSKVRKLFNFD